MFFFFLFFFFKFLTWRKSNRIPKTYQNVLILTEFKVFGLLVKKEKFNDGLLRFMDRILGQLSYFRHEITHCPSRELYSGVENSELE